MLLNSDTTQTTQTSFKQLKHNSNTTQTLFQQTKHQTAQTPLKQIKRQTNHLNTT